MPFRIIYFFPNEVILERRIYSIVRSQQISHPFDSRKDGQTFVFCNGQSIDLEGQFLTLPVRLASSCLINQSVPMPSYPILKYGTMCFLYKNRMKFDVLLVSDLQPYSVRNKLNHVSLDMSS